jgi:cytochrome P450
MTTVDHGHHYKRPSGPKTRIPFLLSLRFLKDPLNILNGLASKYGDISFFRFGRQGIYFVNHPDYIQSVLVNNQSKFIKSPGLRLTKRIVGDGLLTSEGEYHKRQRDLIQPAFDYKHITIYADVVTSCGEDICREWNTDMAGNGTTRVIDLHKEMSKLTMSIISRILFGSTIDSETAGRIIRDVSILVGYFNHLRLPLIGNLIEKLPLASSREFHAAKQHLDSLIFGIIEDSKKNLRVGNQKNSNSLNKQVSNGFQGSNKNNSTDLLSILLLLDTKSTTETGSNNRHATMTDRQLRDEIMTLFLAGHETTANALTWTLYLISKNLDVESKIIEEMKQVLENERPPTMEDIERFQYLRNVFVCHTVF